jgi:hypothetical protein
MKEKEILILPHIEFCIFYLPWSCITTIAETILRADSMLRRETFVIAPMNEFNIPWQ